MHKKIVGIMGPGEGATETNLDLARILARRIAENGWVTLSGGRPSGVMEAAMEAARKAGGVTLGILPDDRPASEFVDIVIRTGLGNARNNINILTCDVVVAIGVGAGTVSEIALGLKAGKPLILMGMDNDAINFLNRLGGNLHNVDQVDEAIMLIRQYLYPE